MSLYFNDFNIFLISEKGDNKETSKYYLTDLNQFVKIYGDIDIEKLDINYIDDYIAYLMDNGYKRTTINRKITSLRSFLFFLNRKGVIKTNIKELDLPKKEIRLPVVLTDEECSSLLDCCKDDELVYLLVFFDLSTGLRVSELLSLKINSLNLKQRYVKVKGKREKERLVPFSHSCYTVLKNYLDKKDKKRSKYLFTDGKYKTLSRQWFYKELKKNAIKAGIKKKIGPHVLRHTFATRLIENGAKLKQIQELLGHKKIETTEIYTHLENKTVKDIYDISMRR
ncbi:MAG: tyrosine-type recombinase/integrase [Candidatus Enterosoma sp.]|nr:tyrosine-type recombinase/integrase [Candidatus Enterosoma sp.]